MQPPHPPPSPLGAFSGLAPAASASLRSSMSACASLSATAPASHLRIVTVYHASEERGMEYMRERVCECAG